MVLILELVRLEQIQHQQIFSEHFQLVMVDDFQTMKNWSYIFSLGKSHTNYKFNNIITYT